MVYPIKRTTLRGGDSSRAVTDDVRMLEGDYFDSSFDWLSYEELDNTVSIYIVKDKETNKGKNHSPKVREVTHVT